jgi:hypothetical protein
VMDAPVHATSATSAILLVLILVGCPLPVVGLARCAGHHEEVIVQAQLRDGRSTRLCGACALPVRPAAVVCPNQHLRVRNGYGSDAGVYNSPRTGVQRWRRYLL